MADGDGQRRDPTIPTLMMRLNSMPGGGSKPGERRGGRQKGTPNKITAEIKALAGVYTQAALDTLAEIMATGQSEAARVSAASELLDRAHGKPRQAIEHSGSITRRVEEISDDELLAIAGGRGAGAAAPESGPAEPDRVH